jgi:alpha-tubulin suppressor-like RCC1 family protein
MFTKSSLHQISVILIVFMILFAALQPSAVSAQSGNATPANGLLHMPTASGFTAIAAGGHHTCGMTSVGGVKCWGANDLGQLGDGTTTDHTAPVDVVGLSSGITAISVGDFHTCVITSSGGVKCWGHNVDGQLGDGTTLDQTTPVDVVGLSSVVTSIAAGGYHTCALVSTGGIKCWGDSKFGQIGNFSATGPQLTPMDVTGLSSGVTAIAAGAEHNCALTSAGGVKCWGHNWSGQLGDGTISELEGGSWAPVDVTGLSSGVTAIAAAGPNTCALTSDGGVKCWGFNNGGEVGDGTMVVRPAPVDVLGLSSGVTAITTNCALTSSDGIKCWGVNSVGQLGNNTAESPVGSVDVVGLPSGVIAIAKGWNHNCALTSSGEVMCWGDNTFGQLGIGENSYHTITVDVQNLSSGVIAISANDFNTCAITTIGGVKCWGANWTGQLGDGTTNGSTTPVDVVGLTNSVVAVSIGESHTCALTSSGGVKCWGANSAGQLGNGTTDNSSTPVDVVGLSSGVAAITAGYNHTCALTNNGGVKCWGGDYPPNTTPVDLVGFSSGVIAITPRLILTQGGKGYYYGGFFSGESEFNLPGNSIAITDGDFHFCALLSTGGIICWGLNFEGELGNGMTSEDPAQFIGPVDVVGLSSAIIEVAAGEYHTCGLSVDGGVKCWGGNWAGQLGNNTTTSSSMPVNVAGLSNGITAIAAGTSHTCALTSTGGVKCWGSNSNGQLGDGTAGYSAVPMYVVDPTFADVPANYWAWGWIERLRSAGLTEGCSSTPEEYCPDETVTRAQGAVLLEKGIHNSSSVLPLEASFQASPDIQPTVAPTFTDILGHWAEDWINEFQIDGMTAGCATGLFCPENPITRAQMAVFLLKARYGSSYLPPEVGDDTGFDDVSVDYWASVWIKQLALEQITVGCGGGKFCPDDPVTRAQMAVFLVKTFVLP